MPANNQNNNHNNHTITNLFALLDDEQTPIRRIPLTQDFQQALGGFFADQRQAFVADKQTIAFTGSWTEQEQQVSFQVFDTGKLLSKGWTLIGSGGDLQKAGRTRSDPARKTDRTL